MELRICRGAYKGAQAIIRKDQPLAVFVHCGAHCTNLVVNDACAASRSIAKAQGPTERE